MYNSRTYSLLARRGYVPGQDFNIRKLPNGAFEVEWLIPSSGPPTQVDLEIEAERDEKIEELKTEALRRARIVYDHIQSLDQVRLIQDQYLAVKPDARQPLSGRLLTLKQTRDAAMDAMLTIRSLTGDALETYDVKTQPEWP